MNKNLNMVDVMKFVMAFCVIGIHSYIFGPQELPSFLNYFVMTAVSFYITASGYLCFRNKTSVVEVEWRLLAQKFLKLYLMWTLIYLPLIAFDYWQTDECLTKVLMTFLHNLLVTGSNPWAYHLWYLLAVAIACALIGLFAKMQMELTGIWTIGISLMIIGYWAVKDDGLIGHTIQTVLKNANNGLTYGFGSFATGMMITHIKRYRLIICLLCVWTGYVFFCNALPLSGLLGGAGIFIICKNINLKDHSIYRHLRTLSSWIYFLHMYVVFIIMVAILHGWMSHDRWMGWMLASVMTLVVSGTVYLLSLKYNSIRKLVK